MNQLQIAREFLEKSLTLWHHNYRALKELFKVLSGLQTKGGTIERIAYLLRLDPHNPTVYNDALEEAARAGLSWAELLSLLGDLKTNFPQDPLVQASCDLYCGEIQLCLSDN